MQFSFQAERPDGVNMAMMESCNIVTIQSAVSEGVIKDDNLAYVPEVLPYLFKLAGELGDDIYRHHEYINKPIQYPIIRNCFCHCFAKGAESAFVWHESPRGKFTFNYNSEDALSGRAGARVNDEIAVMISAGMMKMENVFFDLQDKVFLDENIGMRKADKDERWSADLIACGLYSASAVGIDFGMNLIGFK